jgi:predicted Zn-dependent peptidase
VTVNVVPGSSDVRQDAGFAHLFEHICPRLAAPPMGGFDRLLEAAGCRNNGSTTVDRTNYYRMGRRTLSHAVARLDRIGHLLPEIRVDSTSSAAW